MLSRSLVRPFGLLTFGLLGSLLPVACGGDDGEGGNATVVDGGIPGRDAGVDPGTPDRDADADSAVESGAPAACGDGIVNAREACDDGNATGMDGCSADCTAIEQGYACPVAGKPCIFTVVCGDARIGGGETCDDGNATAGDGCDGSCMTEPGWTCIGPGVACFASRCGDGIMVGKEQCDDANAKAGDGCSAACLLELPAASEKDGWICPTAGKPCVRTTCGNGKIEGSEQCDDGNNDMGDGCNPFCRREPACPPGGGACASACGDGIQGADEECEDGNARDGDGCSRDCKVEPGFACTPNSSVPGNLRLPIVLRDFSYLDPPAGALPRKHPDFETYNCGVIQGMVQSKLDARSKPALLAGKGCITSAASFEAWYRDDPTYNATYLQSLALPMQAAGSYEFASTAFFPLDNVGFGNQGNNHNFHFTSEVRYYFEYRGGERVAFDGDDDVWVFVNRQLATDLGGVHGPQSGSVLLGDSDGNGVIDGAESAATTDARFGLTKGKLYEIAVFQAERHTAGSNYDLTLASFSNPATTCLPK